MAGLQAPFFLGKRSFPNNIFYSPLAGCSDFPFRKIVSQYNPGLIYCEMVKMDALVRHDPSTYRILDYDSSMHPIGAQLCGSKLEYAATAARIIEDLGFDVVDLNCGCPVDKVTKDGSGSGLLRTPEKIGELLHAIVEAVSIPVTVKIRAGWDEDSLNAVEIVSIAEQAGAVAIAVHGRTRKQGYKGKANYEWIRQCKEAAKSIAVIGNGDIFSPQAARRMFDETGCDAVLVSRGTMGQPWIAEDIVHFLEKGIHINREPGDFRSALREHFYWVSRYATERKAVLDFRRIGCWYIKRSPRTRAWRAKIARVQTMKEVEESIEELSLEDFGYNGKDSG